MEADYGLVLVLRELEDHNCYSQAPSKTDEREESEKNDVQTREVIMHLRDGEHCQGTERAEMVLKIWTEAMSFLRDELR